ncbi:hypothetical protein AB6735_14505 [Mucilaginibacter sp. RCC_168]|uniref:hypothetical protein n=1 Tax=Mucilaginibacter sp. RCC_168 TaxID=3239221 RepID=UPI0035268229
MIKNSNNRFIDVLLALNNAEEYNQLLGRIQLQKYIYLSDTISVIWDILAPAEGHETYKNGPFDESITNAVDVLAFRGFVVVESMHMEHSKVAVSYKISKAGIKLFEALNNEEHFQNKIMLFNEMAKHIEKTGWKKLMELVYSEPTYIQSRATGYGYKFDYMSLFTNESLRILYQFEEMLQNGQRITKQNMLSLFFKLLN